MPAAWRMRLDRVGERVGEQARDAVALAVVVGGELFAEFGGAGASCECFDVGVVVGADRVVFVEHGPEQVRQRQWPGAGGRCGWRG
jgi:hypothetical protein